MAEKTVLNIGFDDTDSPKGMCTTFLAYKVAGLLRAQDAEFLDFPRLVRLNPNIPWKTRGNGAVSMRIRTADPARTKRQVRDLVSEHSDTENGANPGLAFLEGGGIPQEFTDFSNLALWQLISRRNAKEFAKKNGLDFSYLGNGQGLVGAIGAIGYSFGDHTLELLSYRKRAMFGKERRVSAQSVRTMQERTFPDTFNSFDTEKGRVMIAPRGPDPVFYGVRGENAESLIHATGIIRSDERPDGYMIFRSNQGTGDHLRNRLTPESMRPFASGTIAGTVSGTPRTEKGGHVFFMVVSEGHESRCAAYRPTGLGSAAANLIAGDRVCVGGGVRKASKRFPRAINLEFIDVMRLEKNMAESNPLCKKCDKKMKSCGRGQGFRCIRCKKTASEKERAGIPRKIKRRLYLPRASAHRHLTRPLQRMGLSNSAKFDGSAPWIHRYKN